MGLGHNSLKSTPPFLFYSLRSLPFTEHEGSPLQTVLCCSHVCFLGFLLLVWVCLRHKAVIWHSQGMTRVSCMGCAFYVTDWLHLVMLVTQTSLTSAHRFFFKGRQFSHGLCSQQGLQTEYVFWACFCSYSLSEREIDNGPHDLGWSNWGPGEEFQEASSLIDSPFK